MSAVGLEVAAVMVAVAMMLGVLLGLLLGWWMARMAKRVETELLRGYVIAPEQEPGRQTEPGS